MFRLIIDQSIAKPMYDQHPALVDSMRNLLEKYIRQGRSTPGKPQNYVKPEKWPGLDWIK